MKDINGVTLAEGDLLFFDDTFGYIVEIYRYQEFEYCSVETVSAQDDWFDPTVSKSKFKEQCEEVDEFAQEDIDVSKLEKLLDMAALKNKWQSLFNYEGVK